MFQFQREEAVSEANWKVYKQSHDLGDMLAPKIERGMRDSSSLVHDIDIDERTITGKTAEQIELEVGHLDYSYYDQISGLCGAVGDFLSKNLREKSLIQLTGTPDAPVSVTKLRTYVKSQAMNMRAFAARKQQRLNGEKDLLVHSYEQSAVILEGFLTTLHQVAVDDTLEEQQHESFFRELVQLRAELFEHAYRYELLRLEVQLDQEVKHYTGEQGEHAETVVVEPDPESLLARTLLRSQQFQMTKGAGVERLITKLTNSFELFEKRYREWRPPELGFHAATEPIEEVNSSRITHMLTVTSGELRELFEALDQKTGLDLQFRLHIQNALTIADALRVHIERRGLHGYVSTSEVPGLLQHVAGAKYALLEICEHLQTYKEEVFT